MNAAAEAPLTARILGAIARSTSKHPANAADVLAQVGGKETDFWSAIATLIHGRAIASAHIQRQRPVADPAPWLAIWPTGVNLDSGAWRSDTHSSLFSGTRTVPRFPAAPDPTRDPRPDLGVAAKRIVRSITTSKPTKETIMPVTDFSAPEPKSETVYKPARTTRKAQGRRDRVSAAIAGCSRANAIELMKIAEAIGLTPEGTAAIIKHLEEDGVAQRFHVGKGIKRRCWVFDPRTEIQDAKLDPDCIADNGATHDACKADHLHGVTEMAAQPAYRHDDIEVHDLVAGDASIPDSATEVRIALWDDGSISFVEEEKVTQFDRSVVERLALLLGVPRNTAPAQAMTQFPVLNS